MEFEWDPEKSKANKEKHGIDFEEAQEIWKSELRIEAQALTTEEEIRKATIGKIDDALWVAIWTPRNEKVRFISVHRAEGTKYEKRYKEQT
ncbi:MAG: hypothetical protein A3D19_09055 [Deltaproteobacteria bacterium RIFCSPHIGHO2_02_FULL_38_15]|nr:MAG: hypothetical protein A3D19_09055 [Deltaproteobacteria bacterium RIFCSPHIGHO2_02_FULL_38_15]